MGGGHIEANQNTDVFIGGGSFLKRGKSKDVFRVFK